jgi:heterodisulfide reductase subunit B
MTTNNNNKMNNEYKKYEEIRDELNKLIDKYGVNETIDAMAESIVWITEDDSIELIKERLDIFYEISEELENEN